MIEIDCGDSMIGVSVLVVEEAAGRPVAVTTISSLPDCSASMPCAEAPLVPMSAVKAQASR